MEKSKKINIKPQSKNIFNYLFPDVYMKNSLKKNLNLDEISDQSEIDSDAQIEIYKPIKENKIIFCISNWRNINIKSTDGIKRVSIEVQDPIDILVNNKFEVIIKKKY